MECRGASACAHGHKMKDASTEMGIFTEALRLPAAERADYLDRACAGDGNLRRKIDALLKAHDRVGDFLELPPTDCKNGTNSHSIEE